MKKKSRQTTECILGIVLIVFISQVGSTGIIHFEISMKNIFTEFCLLAAKEIRPFHCPGPQGGYGS